MKAPNKKSPNSADNDRDLTRNHGRNDDDDYDLEDDDEGVEQDTDEDLDDFDVPLDDLGTFDEFDDDDDDDDDIEEDY